MKADDHPPTDPRLEFWRWMFAVVLGIACALLLAWAVTRPGW